MSFIENHKGYAEIASLFSFTFEFDTITARSLTPTPVETNFTKKDNFDSKSYKNLRIPSPGREMLIYLKIAVMFINL